MLPSCRPTQSFGGPGQGTGGTGGDATALPFVVFTPQGPEARQQRFWPTQTTAGGDASATPTNASAIGGDAIDDATGGDAQDATQSAMQQDGDAQDATQSAMQQDATQAATPRTMSRWNEWLATPEVANQFTFEKGERIFEFSDSYSRTGWKPYDRNSQMQLRTVFDNLNPAREATAEVDCLGWNYVVKFDLFRNHSAYFVDAPAEAIGYQTANHERGNGNKRWIRLTTFQDGGAGLGTP